MRKLLALFSLCLIVSTGCASSIRSTAPTAPAFVPRVITVECEDPSDPCDGMPTEIIFEGTNPLVPPASPPASTEPNTLSGLGKVLLFVGPPVIGGFALAGGDIGIRAVTGDREVAPGEAIAFGLVGTALGIGTSLVIAAAFDD